MNPNQLEKFKKDPKNSPRTQNEYSTTNPLEHEVQKLVLALLFAKVATFLKELSLSLANKLIKLGYLKFSLFLY